MIRRSLLIALFLLSACNESGDDGVSPVLARVGDEVIRGTDLASALAQTGLGEATPDLGRRALDELIDRRLLLREAQAKGLRIPDREIDRAFAGLQADYPGDQFTAMLLAEGMDAAAFRARLRESLLVQRLIVDEVVARVAITDDEVDAWLESQPGEQERPEQVRAAQIVVRTEDEARRIHEELSKGASFAELAKAHSLSPDGKQGGDLGFFARGEMPPPFDEICFALVPGKVSEVVSSSYGFHVFKLLERRSPARLAPERLRAEAERRLRREKEAAVQMAFLARLRAATQIDVDEAALARLLGNP